MKIDIWSDIACPWCFIGKRRFETALARFPHRDEVEVRWHSFQLDPSLPQHFDGTEVQYLSERKGIDPQQLAGMLDEVTVQAAGEGLSYDYDSLVVANSFSAHRLIHLAKAEGGLKAADAAKEALLSAHFEKGMDIGAAADLVQIGTSVGLDADRVTGMLASDEYADDVNADIAQARSLGISGVPFFVLDDKYGISGAQPADLFTSALEQAWQESHPLISLTPESVDGPACGPDGC
ncbi:MULTISPECIES: DsbA family oxidoreductase [unclassified Arthrobacter]|uniref:DsbA family oxidoreductase n=1 Tax=unclassified Arthrobacter TaxID=235627 RepID=UPI001E475E3B|nr:MULTISPECIES: DsbA family oxidoreductase [unclassified Arthrobacter]MCC9146774.1 DsbA family oxidoreductase [Arthrobacter sp. zg-Y919]MDK1278005.1 DsbA family oxidoreductase [Arthrobacter sp. zg.Y919]WIB03404.1 DsbA family oxidoreductase [Arthrobacter sp. zg-Y919]